MSDSACPQCDKDLQSVIHATDDTNTHTWIREIKCPQCGINLLVEIEVIEVQYHITERLTKR